MNYLVFLFSFILCSSWFLISFDTFDYVRSQQTHSICSINQDLPDNQSIPLTSYSHIKATTNSLVYENSLFDITLTCPNNWEIREGNDTNTVVEFYSPLPNNSNSTRSALGIYVQDLSEMSAHLGLNTLDDYSNSMVDAIRNISSHNIYPIPSQIGNNPAYHVIYDDKGSTAFQEWTIKNKKAYMLLYMADTNEYSKYQKYMNKVLDSFTIR